MAKKKQAKKKLGKAQHSHLAQLVNAYKPERVGDTYIKESLSDIIKQIKLHQKPLGELIKAQSSLDAKRFAPRTLEERQANGKAFAAWLAKHAPKSFLGEKFEFKWDVAEGSGLVATKDLKKHENFICVPRKVMLTSTQAGTTKLGTYLKKDQMFGTMPHLMLAVHLMFESLDPNSFYKPYIDVLPRTFNLPLFFSIDELAALEGSPTYYDALKMHKQTLRQYMTTHKLLGAAAKHLALPSFTYRDFVWAVGVMMTRQNRIPSANDKDKHVLALIPGWDMCNFRHGEVATQFNDETDSSESFTMEDVKKGDQIYIYYGNRPNSKLFLFSGFVATDHKTDYVEGLYEADSKADEKDPIRKIKKITLMNRRMRETMQAFRVHCSTGMPSDACMTWHRIKSMDKKEATEVLKLKTPLVGRLSDRNERAAGALLAANATRLLKGYPTSIAEDEKLLTSTDLSKNVRVAVQLRLQEKKALTNCLEYAKKLASGQDTAPAPSVEAKK